MDVDGRGVMNDDEKTLKSIRRYETDLTFFKVATVCGHPGASPKWLPFIHQSFPATPTPISARFYAPPQRKEVIKVGPEDSKALVCYRKICNHIELPEILNRQKTRDGEYLTRCGIGYVNKNKVCFKLKGIDPKEVYSVNRVRPAAPLKRGNSCLRINSQKYPFEALDPWNLALESVAKATTLRTSLNLKDYNSSSSDLTSYGKSMTNIGYSMFDDKGETVPRGRRFVPALRQRKLREGQALSHVVSTRRLYNILQHDRDKAVG